MEGQKEITQHESIKKYKYYAQLCPVCNGFGTLKYGSKTCQGCEGKGYVVVPTGIDNTEGENNGGVHKNL